MDTEEDILANVKNLLKSKNPEYSQTNLATVPEKSFLSLFTGRDSKKSANNHRKSKTLLANFTDNTRKRDTLKSTDGRNTFTSSSFRTSTVDTRKSHQSKSGFNRSSNSKNLQPRDLKKKLSDLSTRSKLSSNKNYHRLDDTSFHQLEHHLSQSTNFENGADSDSELNVAEQAAKNAKSGLQMDRNLAVQAFALQQVYNKDEERRELEMARAFELDIMVADSRLKQISAADPKRLMSTVSNRFLLSDESRLYHSELMDCKKNGLYHPNTHFRKTWDLITLILIMYTSLATPLVLAFYDFNPYYKTSGRSRRSISAYIDVIVDIWFIFDIYLTFNTAYYLGSHDLLITNKKSVRMHYTKGFFLIDLAAVFPFEPLAALQKLDGNKALSTFSVLKMFKLSRMVRVIRIAKVSKMLSDLEEKYGIDIGIVKSYSVV